MKKFSLIATLILGVLLLQNCKKDTQTAIATSTRPLIASINDTTWNPTSESAAITYYAATNTKVFTCSGVDTSKNLVMKVTQNKSSNTPGFPLANFVANTTTDNTFTYNLGIKNSAGTFVFSPVGSAAPGSGELTVTAIDSVKKTITGTFSFTIIKNNYDANGNIASVSVAQISSGGFNSIPYTFTSN